MVRPLGAPAWSDHRLGASDRSGWVGMDAFPTERVLSGLRARECAPNASTAA